MRCAFCGRSMASASVLVGLLPVGPQCARRAGLLDKARRGIGALRLGSLARTAVRRPDAATRDLFDEQT